MRTWAVSAFFPEVKPAHMAEQSIVVKASDIGTAARRAIDGIRERGGIKGKRIATVKLTVQSL